MAFDDAKRAITGIYCVVCWLLTGVTLASAQEAFPSCLSASGEAAVIACRRELSLAPHDLDIRFALSDALIGLQRHREAVEVLREGLERSPGNTRIKKKLSLTESHLEEQLWIDKRREQQADPSGATASKKLDTETKLNMIRCTRLKGDRALKACNTALNLLPKDPSLHRSKADALMDMDRIGEAILAYRESLRLAPDDAETSNTLSRAQSKRKAIAAECQRLAGSAALSACEAALLVGARDEFVIQSRRGDLLSGMKRRAEAEEAYRRALDLSPNDRGIKEKLDALTKPVSIAKVDETAKPRKESKPQEPVSAQQPSDAPTPPLSKERVREIEAPVQTVRLGQSEPTEDTDSSPAHESSASPLLPTPRRYSNRPPVAGITH